MKFKGILLGAFKFIFSVCCFFPAISFANHLLSITANSPFPASQFVSTVNTASYTIQNVSPITVTAVNKSQFPTGMSVTSSTCGNPLSPGQTCAMTLQYSSPSTAQAVSTSLNMWAMPTADGVESPISINVVVPVIITPSAGANGSISPSSVLVLFSGSSVTFTAIPASTYIVNQWLVDGVAVQTGGTTYTLSNITANHTVEVTFGQYTVTPSAGTGGTISPSTAQVVNSGSNITFTAAPASQYLINQWLLDGTPVQTGGATYTLSNITANHTVQVTFTPPLTITPSAGTGGTISPSSVQTITSGGSASFTATPASGFIINQWLLDGSPVQTGGSTYTLSNVTANHTVGVNFTQQFTVTPSADANSSITPNTPQVVNNGSNISFTAAVSAGYIINTWLLDGTVVQTGGTSYTLNTVTANHTVQVTSLQQFTLTPSAGSGGSISPSTVQTVTSASSPTVFTATPSSQYLVNQWLLDGNPVQTGGTTYTISNVTANHTVQVTFTPPLTVTPSAGTGGTITPNTPQTVTSGNNITFTAAVTLPQYLLNQWLVDGVAVQTGGTTYTINNVTANHTVEITFTAPWTITPSAGSGGSISPSTVQMVTNGDSVTFTASPQTQYVINQWLVDSIVVQTGGNNYTLNNVTANHAVNVTFNPPNIVTPSAGANGTISPSTPQSVISGNSFTFTATPSMGYAVTQWLLDSTPVQTGGNSYMLTNITAAHSVTVNFAAKYTVTPTAGSNGTISPSTPQIVTSGSNLTFTATPAAQYAVNQWLLDTVAVQNDGTTYTLSNIIANHAVNVTFVPVTLVAAGYDSANSLALIAASMDGGNTWAVQTITSNINAVLESASCTGNGTTAYCIAAGNTSGTPFLVTSSNGGTTWTKQLVFAAQGLLGASCTGSASTNIICATSTQDGSSNPIIVVYNSGASSSWTPTSITGLSDPALIEAVSCTGGGLNAICIAAGQDSSSSAPLLAASTDGVGGTWTLMTIPSIAASGYFNGASCTGSGSSAVCVAAGQGYSTGEPLLAVSTNGGTSFSVATISSFTDKGLLYGASCTGNGASAICTAVGQDITTSLPLIVMSTNGGVTWTAATISSFTDHGIFYSANCTGAGSSAICTAAGQDTTTGLPLLVVSTNGGSTWAVATTTPRLINQGYFNSTTCTGSVCIAAGHDNILNAPTLVQSINGGIAWTVPPIASIPTNGSFNGAGASNFALERLTRKRFGVKNLLEKFF